MLHSNMQYASLQCMFKKRIAPSGHPRSMFALELGMRAIAVSMQLFDGPKREI